MPSLFGDVSVALRALQSHQVSIETISNNVSNANTPGYHRQEAVLSAGLGYTPPTMRGSAGAGMIGGGVVVQDIRRYTTDFLDTRYRGELASSKRWNVESTALQQVEATMAETNSSDGLVAKLDAFWSGWQALSADPTNMAVRADLRDRATNLTDAFHRRAQALNSLRSDQDLGIVQRVQEVNQDAVSIARLNVEIARVKAAEQQPNDLMDQRDTLANRLAELVGATATTQPNGEMIITISGSTGAHSLVFGSTYSQLVTFQDPTNTISGSVAGIPLTGIRWNDGQPFVSGSSGMAGMSNGELAGLFHARDQVMPAQLQGLNETAGSVAALVNALHQTGYDMNAATGLNFFAPFAPIDITTGDYALAIHLSAGIVNNLSTIAAAGTSGSVAGAVGDGTTALALGNLQYQQYGWSNGDVATINHYYTSKVGELGLAGQTATTAASDRKLVADSLDQQRQSENGVSLDDEAAKLMVSQKAYQAAAKVMNALDDMMNRLINGLGQ